MSQLIKINPNRIDRVKIKKAANVVKRGGLVIFPTETVYGIAAKLENSKKLDKIKKRPKGKPYTVHIAYKKDLFKYINKLSPIAKKVIKKYWPGPLTILLCDKNGNKMGFRMPDNKIALSLIRSIGKPIIAPSANVSGKPSPTSVKNVCSGSDLIIDGGETRYRKSSTIVDLSNGNLNIIRKGTLKIKI